MNFSDALYALRAGAKVQRAGWNGKGMWLELQVPDANSKMTLPYIFLSYPPFVNQSDMRSIGSPDYPDGARVPWLASQTDMLADDWVYLDE